MEKYFMKLHLTTSKAQGLANVRKIKTCKKKPKTNEIGIYDLIHHVDEPDLFHLIQELSYNYFQTFIWGGLIILIFGCVSSAMWNFTSMRSTGGPLIVGHFDIVDIFMVSWDAIDNIGGEGTSAFDELSRLKFSFSGSLMLKHQVPIPMRHHKKV